jgi:hypothetical protein
LLGALLVSVLDLLGGGVDLLFALTLATLGVNQGGDGALALETGTGDGELVLKLSGTENNAVDVAFGLLLNFGSIIQGVVKRSCFSPAKNVLK